MVSLERSNLIMDVDNLIRRVSSNFALVAHRLPDSCSQIFQKPAVEERVLGYITCAEYGNLFKGRRGQSGTLETAMFLALSTGFWVSSVTMS